MSATPTVAYALNRAFTETDLSDVLPAVRVPALVLYRSIPEERRWRWTWPRGFRAPARCGFPATTTSAIFLSLDIVDELERFVAGEEAPFVPESVLATVMFTDLVASTARAAEAR